VCGGHSTNMVSQKSADCSCACFFQVQARYAYSRLV
jgi:hypothetical protein